MLNSEIRSLVSSQWYSIGEHIWAVHIELANTCMFALCYCTNSYLLTTTLVAYTPINNGYCIVTDYVVLHEFEELYYNYINGASQLIMHGRVIDTYKYKNSQFHRCK